ncbi:dioxygenase [Bifidobacterium sp. UTCIF-39]|uniref:AmmeMemoRadiSam system protein B n=1 Tax=Bifidobacterium sp. UTCIF-39 TaxID=1465359 RepID=UPI00112986B7|nr:AmmeMemoRadiSam system protein B [Bifidobacterium sp. UTCIF-39]TPF95606.1 dioxygenase [Bifidobacterium sp. UTCIF-39]
MKLTENIRHAAVAGAFYPANPRELRTMIDRQLDYARGLLNELPARALPQGAPKAVIVPHAGYVYSGTAAALAYALLERGRGTIHRAVIIGPTHRVAVRGVAMCRATAFATPLGDVPVDIAGEAHAFGLSTADADPATWRNGMRASDDAPAPAMLVNDPTHAREHAVEVQIPFLQTVLGADLQIVPLNAGDASPAEVGDVIRALWGGPETVIVISSDLSHYHPNEMARALDDRTIERITNLDGPIHPNFACGAYPVNGLLDVCRRESHTNPLDLRFLGCSTSGDDGEVALSRSLLDPSRRAHGDVLAHRPVPLNPDEPVVGYASFAAWPITSDDSDDSDESAESATAESDKSAATTDSARARIAISLARLSLRRYLGIEDPDDVDPQTIVDEYDWLRQPGASFVTLTEGGHLRGCIGTLEAYRPLGRDIAEHAIDAASRDPRFRPVTASEYPLLDVEVSVLGRPEPMLATSREELEAELRPGTDGLIIDDGHGHRATFLPQVWDELPSPHDFVSHLLMKSGLPATTVWNGSAIRCHRYAVTAYKE